MCLITNKKEQVAQEDIIVYKLLNINCFDGEIYSPYRGFQYELSKTYSSELGTSIESNDIYPFCDFDLTYLEKHFADLHASVKSGQLTCYVTGFHSIFSKLAKEYVYDYMVNNAGNSLFKCIIPKGSIYVEDFVGFVVSNQIIIVEKC